MQGNELFVDSYAEPSGHIQGKKGPFCGTRFEVGDTAQWLRAPTMALAGAFTDARGTWMFLQQLSFLKQLQHSNCRQHSHEQASGGLE